MTARERATIVVVHGAWADGSMAARMGATVRSLAVHHTPILTAPDAVVDLIMEAEHVSA